VNDVVRLNKPRKLTPQAASEVGVILTVGFGLNGFPIYRCGVAKRPSVE
jgi:hypothetical protein